MRETAVAALALCLACGTVSSADDAGTAADAGGGTDAAVSDGAPGVIDASSIDAAIVEANCAAPPVCASAGTVATKEDISAVGQRCATWGEEYVDSLRPRSPTLETTQATSICPGDFALPDDCSEGNCFAAIRITVDPELSGVDPIQACKDGVQLAAGARFRLRFNLEPEEPGQPFQTAHVHFERPCDADCLPEERRCDANDNCYPGSEVCFACGYAGLQECACRDPDNDNLPECSECVFIDFNQVFTGRCVAGSCVAPPEDPCEFCVCE
jgi:hypothetical protein